ncbi:hypothetical protein [Companilactobacillus musae]|uniref:hypothetical protein n=1 Tax=Companilactobacillus musae TaxID=1903258 RepID=UPI000E658455|nr:hypothetical protein [Companilactobacillus musae]
MRKKLSELDEMLNKVLNSASSREEFCLRYLYILLAIANIKHDPDIEIYYDRQGKKDVFTVISGEIESYEEVTVNGKTYQRKV